MIFILIYIYIYIYYSTTAKNYLWKGFILLQKKSNFNYNIGICRWRRYSIKCYNEKNYKKILSIFIQMRKGLNKLYNKKIIYRDVKLEIYFWWKMV